MKEQMNKLSRTSLKERVRKKTSPMISGALALAIKTLAWSKHAKMLSQSTRKHSSVNLSDIDSKVSMVDTVLVPGKVLSIGEITKKIKICSFGISKEALEKLKKTKSSWTSIVDEIKSNQKAEGLKIIK